MKLLTVRQQILDLPGVLRKVWCRSDGTWAEIAQPIRDTEKVVANVEALDLHVATVEDVHAAMGYASGWVGYWCQECGKEADTVIQFDDDENELRVCLDCLRVALKLMKEAE